MRMENAFDRVARALRPVVFLACIFAVPVAFFTYLAMLKLAFDDWGLVWFALTCVAHVIVWLGCSMLLDSQREQRQDLSSSKPLRQTPPDAR